MDDATLHGCLPPGAWRLTASAWPRTGGDAAHRRVSSLPAPREGRLRRVLEHAGGLALGEDGWLRVSVGGSLLAIDGEGALRWRVALVDDERERAISSALLLRGDVSVCSSHEALHFVDAAGRWLGRVDELLGPLDDSGPAPNLAPSGAIVLSTCGGELLTLVPEGRVEQLASRLGYDVPPPAIDEAGTLIVAGYAGAGLIALEPAGARRWRAELRDVDLLPTVDAQGRAAAGSINERASCIVDAAGRELGRVAFAACFAVAAAGWYALGAECFVALDPEGRERWRRGLGARGRWGGLGPIVTGEGHVVVPAQERLLVFDVDGRECLGVALPAGSTWIDLAPWGPGRLALALSSGLYVLE